MCTYLVIGRRVIARANCFFPNQTTGSLSPRLSVYFIQLFKEAFLNSVRRMTSKMTGL